MYDEIKRLDAAREQRRSELKNQVFISRSNKIYGEDLFDYSECRYKTLQIKVKVRCKVHDETFMTRPASHLNGTNNCCGCRYDNTPLKEGVKVKKPHPKVRKSPIRKYTEHLCTRIAAKYTKLSELRRYDKPCWDSMMRHRYDYPWIYQLLCSLENDIVDVVVKTQSNW